MAPRSRAEDDRGAERGTGLIGTTAGLAVFLVLLLFAVQASVGLYTRSMVTGAAYDAAVAVAGYRSEGSRHAATAAAEEGLRRRLGRLGDRLHVVWERPDDPDTVRIHVSLRHPTLLPEAFARALGVARTDRTIDVRVERFR